MKPPVTAEIVQRFPLFADFTIADAEAVASLLDVTSLKGDEPLFRQGDPSDSLFLLIDGEIEITVHIPQHSDHRLVILGPGSIIGEMGPLIDEPRAASAIAISEAHLARLSEDALKAALDRHEGWAGKFLFATAKVLASRLGMLNRELVSTLARADGNSHEPKKVEAELSSLRQRLLKDWTF